MSLSIQGNSLFSFNRTLSHEDVQRAINSTSKEEATHVGIWEKIKDWFCGTNTSEALEKFYVLTHDNDEPDTESILKKVTAFYQLKEMAYPVYQDRFQASITPNEDGTYTFSFSIKDVMDERALVYGNTEKDIYSLKKRELTNNSELLDNDTVIQEGLDVTLNKVKYDYKQNELEGITSANQPRVSLHLLDEETKQEMDINQHLAQKWISLQMKCFDYYAEQRSSLDYSIDSLDISCVIETENEWIYHFAQSINKIRINTQENLAKEFNNEIKEFKDLNIYANPYELNNEPIYSEPYNQRNEPIYENIQFNSSKT
ncbi:MAG: hypothetical protein ACL7AY_15710, partial [Candidatus Arsenophonus phytopathogenicus]